MIITLTPNPALDIEKARSIGMRVILDASGPALWSTLSLAPELVKPNRNEEQPR